MYRRPKFDTGLLSHKEEEDFSRCGTSGANMAVAAQQSISLGTGIRRIEKGREMVPRIKLSVKRVERNK
jgi:hypothetical protein